MSETTIVQRFCTCLSDGKGGANSAGYSRDPVTTLWVHAWCGFPTKGHYIAQVTGPNAVKVPRELWGKPSQQKHSIVSPNSRLLPENRNKDRMASGTPGGHSAVGPADTTERNRRSRRSARSGT